MHSDRTLLAECAAQARYHGLTDDEVFVMPSPVAHVSGLLYGVLLPIWLGATSVLMPVWDPGRFLELVEAERGTFCGGATPFLQSVVDHPELSRHDLSSLRLFPCGGADVPPDLIRRAMERLRVRTGRGYGSTEFPSITSSAGPGEPDDKRAETDGRPIGDNRIRIRDGEIQALGAELFLGYRNGSLDALTDDGWFRTGDLGVIDEDGYLTVTGRLKDIVIRSGEKLSAREIEDLLHEHPNVRAVAVVAIPDARTGERACACVVPADPATPPTLAELTDFLHARGISRRKLPEQLELRAALPMTSSGKVNKHELRVQIATAIG
jgi:cyclohexanecarboxylate-CoA ligase